MGDLPLFYTEWSISSNCTAAIHDTTRAASFLVKTVLDNQGVIDGSRYWTFSDIFEELFFFPDPFCGGFGLLTVDGIKKPAFWAMKLLAQLPDTRYCLPVTDDNVEIAAFHGDNGELYLILYAQSFDDTEHKFPVTVTVENAPPFSTATVQRVNRESGNPIRLWEKMGKPAVLMPAELETIKESGEMHSETLVPDYENGTCTLTLTVENNEIAFVKLQRS